MSYLLFLLLGFPHLQTQVENSGDSITYPFRATPDRQKQIRDGFLQIKVGMTSAQLKTILGKPDEVTPIYDRRGKTENRRGSGYWYWIEKRDDEDANEKFVRVSLDLKEQVIKVEHWVFFDGTGTGQTRNLARAARDEIQGTWESIDKKDEEEAMRLVICADRIISIENGNKSECGYKLDPSRGPKAIDLINIDSKKVGKLIYALNRDELEIGIPWITLPDVDPERPKSFSDLGIAIIRFNRIKR